MKTILCIILLLMSAGGHYLAAQSSVAIGDSNTKASAVLYLKGSGSQGFIIPIVSNTSSIASPEAGMIVYNSGDKNVYYHNGSAWTVIGSVSGGGSTPTLSNGQILTGNGTTNTASTLAGDVTLNGGTITISNNTITSAKIADGTIAASDLSAMSATSGQVLKFNGTSWAPAADAGGVTYTGGTGIAIAGTVISNTGDTNAGDDITTASVAAGDVTGSFSNLQIAPNAVTTTEIANGTITATDLSPMSAANGQVLKYNGTAWVPSADDVGGGATPTLSNGQILTGNGTTNVASVLGGDATLSGGTITISNNAVTSIKIVDGSIVDADITSVAPGKITQAAATTGQVLKWNGTAWAPAADAGGAGTVTAVSVVTANGVSGSVVTPTTTPAITLTLGAITPTSIAATGTITGSNLSGTNTGDNAVNTLYNGLVSNATHTGDATGATALTVRGINGVLLSGLTTGVLKNTTGTGVASIATGADLPVMTATVGGAVPTPPNNTTTFLRGDGTFAAPVNNGWGLTGNAATNPATNYIGTSDSQPLVFRTNATEAMRILTDGKIGIGMTAPTATLDLLGTLKIVDGTQGLNKVLTSDANGLASWQNPGGSGWSINGNSGTVAGTNFIGTVDNVDLSIKTNNLQRMTIDNAGRVRLQPNNAVATAPAVTNAILDIVPTGPAGGGIGNMVLRGSNQNQNDPVDIEFKTWDGATTLAKVSVNPGASDLWLDANGATRLALQNDGDVGIGTTNPGQKLEVVGNVNIGNTNSYMINNLAVVSSNSASGNIFVGANSGLFNTAISGTFLGTAAGRDNTTGTDNTFIGRNAGLVNTAGTLNVMVGSGAGQASTGSGNTFVGYRAGFVNTSGVRNTLIGREADVASANLTNATAIGFQAIAGASNTMVLGGTGANAVNVGVGITTPSKQIHSVSAPLATYDAAIYGSSSATDGAGFFGAMAYDGGTTNFGLYAHSDAIANTSPLGVNRGADGALVNFYSANSLEGQISVSGTTITYGAFTGVHYAQSGDEEIERGMLVSLNGNNGNLHDKKTSELLYGITKTAVPNDTKVMGTYLGLMDPLVEKSSDNPIQIMAVGNGDMWIVDNGKNLEAGDYLISSDLAGYAMLDKSVYDIAHVIARIGQNVNWNDVQQKVNGRKVINVSVFFENFEINHKAEKLIAEIEVLNSKVNSMKEKQDTEVALLKEQMEEVLRIMGASAKRKN